MSLLLPMMLKKTSATPVEYLGHVEGDVGSTLTVPAYVQAGDYCIAITNSAANYSYTVVTPAGFTPLHSINVGSSLLRIKANFQEKVMDGSETSLMFATGIDKAGQVMLFFRGKEETNLIEYTTNTQIAPTSIATTKGSVVIVCGLASDTSGTFEAPTSDSFIHITTRYSNGYPRVTLSYRTEGINNSLVPPDFNISDIDSYLLVSIVVSP